MWLGFAIRAELHGKPERAKVCYSKLNDLLPDFNYLVVIVLFGEVTDAEGYIISNNYVTNVWAVFIYSKR